MTSSTQNRSIDKLDSLAASVNKLVYKPSLFKWMLKALVYPEFRLLKCHRKFLQLSLHLSQLELIQEISSFLNMTSLSYREMKLHVFCFLIKLMISRVILSRTIKDLTEELKACMEPTCNFSVSNSREVLGQGLCDQDESYYR